MLSPSKRQLSDWTRLTQKKYRRESGSFLVEGAVCVREAIRTRIDVEAVLVLASEMEAWEAELSRSQLPFYAVNADAFDRFAPRESSQGILAVAHTFRLPPRQSKLVIACEQVSDPGNCGALIRVADFFGAGELLLGPGSAEIWNPKVVRGSMGSLFQLPVRSDVNFEKIVRDWPGDSVAAVAHGGTMLTKSTAFRPPVLLVLGHETRGLSGDVEALCSQRVTLKPAGQAESLNLVTAAAVFAYALT
jgi:TrmH family RNA methyltransferase